MKATAANAIRARIVAGELRPGDKLKQDQLADEFGVSRFPVREALITLESEGLVETIPHRGAFVAPLTEDDVRDHYEVFGAVSGLAAARASTLATPDDLAALRQLIAEMGTAEDGVRLGRLCFEFHRLVNHFGSTQRLRSELRRLTEGIPVRGGEVSGKGRAQARADHAAILRAIQVTDRRQAFETTLNHFARAGRSAVGHLHEAGFWDTAIVSPSPTRRHRRANNT